MKLLLDQNLSYRLVKSLSDEFSGITHVSSEGLLNATDRDIWDFAKKYDYAIVTFDADFYDLFMSLGQPPKVIWIRNGNQRTSNISKLLKEHVDQILDFLKNADLGCLLIE